LAYIISDGSPERPWSYLVDGKRHRLKFDEAYPPRFSADGRHVIVFNGAEMPILAVARTLGELQLNHPYEDPGETGKVVIEVLRKIKADTNTKTIPVVVLTSSKEDPDISICYELGVNAYVVKPVGFENFSKAVSEIGLFWLLFNEIPHKEQK